MTQNFHDPIQVGESNNPNTVNTRLGDIDAALTNQATELTAAAGPYANLSDRLDSMVLAGGNIASFATVAAPASQPIVNLDSATGFIEGARVAYALAGGSVEYNTIDNVGSFGVVTFANDIGAGGIPENGIVSMISESEYQASQVLTAAETGVSRTLTTAITWLEREVNVKAFGAIGDGSSHLVGGGAALTAAQAKYPLTHTAFIITATDEHDYCAIQEAILAAQSAGTAVEDLYIPRGHYLVNRMIVVPKNLYSNSQTLTIRGAGFRGTGRTGTLIEMTAADTLFLLSGTTAITNLTLQGDDLSDSSSIAIRIGAKTASTNANGAASAGQKVVTVDSTTGFLAGERIAYPLANGTIEFNTIDTVDSGVQLTLDNNIGTGGIVNNAVIEMPTVENPFNHTNCVHVTISRIYFQTGWYRCIFSLYECDQLHIEHCSGFGIVGQAAVYLSNDCATNGISPSANVVIENNAFSHTASITGGECLYGIYLLGTENSVIRNSVVRGYDHQIYLDAVNGSRNYNLLIDGIHSEINQNLKDYDTERWTPNTAYSAGDIVRPMAANANGFWYKCTGAGTSAASSIRNTSYQWTASTRGTNEYYLEASGGGDPSISEPFGVMENGTSMSFGFAGRLTAGQWGYGQTDGQGFNTIYVRLTDSTDPDGKATHYLWTSTNEPTWPTTYGATVNDNGLVWTAYKRTVFCGLSPHSEATIGGLRITGCYCDTFALFVRVNTTTSGVVRVAIDNCSVLTCDMVYSTVNNIRASLIAENSQLDGSIRPYATLNANNAQTAVMLRFVKRANDLVGALGNAENGISTWFTGEINSSYSTFSLLQVNDANATIDLINHSQVIVSTDSAVTLYVPRITSDAWINGLLGRQYSIVHGDGTENMTLQFTSAQAVLYNDSAPTSIAMNDIGDTATIKLSVRFGGTARWFLAGSYGI